MSSNGGSPQNQRLDSWKEIAAYLRRDERTAIRWEKDRGLPVRRVPGGKRQAVFAFTSELDAWLTQQEPQGLKPSALAPNSGTSELIPFPITEPNGSATGAADAPVNASVLPTSAKQSEVIGQTSDMHRHWPRQTALRYGLFAVCILIISGLGIALSGRRFARGTESIPVRLAFTTNSVQAFDQQDHFLWNYPFPKSLELSLYKEQGPYYGLSFIGDFLGDGGREALIPVVFQGSSISDPPLSEVDLLSNNGKLLWFYAPTQSFQFGKNLIGEQWLVTNLFVSHHNQKPEIWTSFGHGTWGNTFIVNLDPINAKQALRFVNTGTVHALGEFQSGGKNYLFVGGFNNESDSASLAITDEARPFAASPQTPGTRHECLSCPPGKPDFYLIFPRSELADLEGHHEDAVKKVLVTGDQIEVLKSDIQQPSLDLDMFYELRIDQAFHPIAFRFGSGYDMLHRRLEREGKLNHTLENCPERLHPKPIKMWTPSGGWTTIQLPPTPFNQ